MDSAYYAVSRGAIELGVEGGITYSESLVQKSTSILTFTFRDTTDPEWIGGIAMKRTFLSGKFILAVDLS